MRNVKERYEIVEKIGQGAYGSVYLVRDREAGRHLALKTISKARAARQPEGACVMAERRILGLAGATWLVRLEEAFQDELFLYLVMEYLPGGDLSALDPEQHGLPEDAVRFYAAELVLALEELHARGWAHRDVKPGNVMLRADGHVRLADFGSAGRVGADGRVWSRAAVGTPDYVSPEALLAQQSRGGAAYGVGCDWWGLGVLLWELLLGEPPFYAPSLVQTYQNIQQHGSLDIAGNARLSPAARDLLARLLCAPEARLDAAGIRAHAFFAGVDWAEVAQQLAVPPMVPELEGVLDTSRFFLDADDADDGLPGAADPEPARPRRGLEGSQLPFAGYTHCPRKVYQVAYDALPVLRRMESSRVRLDEIEAQVADMRINGETAKLVSQQIKRIASADELPRADRPDESDLQAAYEALLQNYDFLQCHYEGLLAEHEGSARQMQALLGALQEQEDARHALEADVAGLQAGARLDKLKIAQLVTKLSSTPLAAPAADGHKDKQLLKRRAQECKALQHELHREALAKQRLEQELADARATHAVLQQEHEALLGTLRAPPGAPLDRRKSDASMLKHLFRGTAHTRTASVLADTEGPVKMLMGATKGRRGKLEWRKTHLCLRDAGLWAAAERDRTLALLAGGAAEGTAVWAQPVQPADLHQAPMYAPLCFKVRSAAWGGAAVAAPPQAAADPAAQQARVLREEKILKGALQLLEAAHSDEQRALAQSHVDASRRLLADLAAGADSAAPAVGHGGHEYAEGPAPLEQICEGCIRPVGSSGCCCAACGTWCHRACRAIVGAGCAEAQALAAVVPAYFMAASSDEARRWIRAVNSSLRGSA